MSNVGDAYAEMHPDIPGDFSAGMYWEVDAFSGWKPTTPAVPVVVRSRVGSKGQLLSAFAKIEKQNIGGGSETNASSRAFVRRLGNPTDDAGHAVGNNLGGRGIIGSNTTRNVFPQDPHTNQGVFRDYELGVAEAVERGDEVFVRVVPKYQCDQTRPYRVVYQTRINGVTSFREFVNP
jgi:hypothetical protein